MRSLIVRPWSRVVPLWFTCAGLFAQAPSVPPAPAPPRIEPGLDEAVRWKWRIAAPATQAWGLPLPEALAPKAAAGSPAAPAVVEARPATYAVVKGDALVKIARRFHLTVPQLKQFNGLKSDLIVIGQVLRIPTPAELLEMPPPPPPPEPKAKPGKGKQKDDAPPADPLASEPRTYEQLVLETVLLQVFLDREMFSPGAIDGKSGPAFLKVAQLYQQAFPDAADKAQMKAKALAAVKQPYVGYILRAEDFKFIQPRKAELPPAPPALPGAKNSAAKKPGAKVPKAVPVIPPLAYQEMVAADFLGYASVWEFVAERFHCDEAFLRELNDNLIETPEIGTVFQVPNVIPFEIEKALDPPLQPAADPDKPVTATVVGLSRLEISRGGKLVAVIPLASARPGLHGRGTWTVLDAVPQPRLTTRREPREAPPARPGSDPAPAPEQVLAPGPNNPVGILWIHLAKADSSEPLPYGLHGTSIPARMRSQEGIGGFRLANWDIARTVRLLPTGTALQWKAQ